MRPFAVGTVAVCVNTVLVDGRLCCIHKDTGALSSSFKSILRAGDFNIEQTRVATRGVQRSDDSGCSVDDLAEPEAPSPSSTVSNESSSGSEPAPSTSGNLSEPTRPTSEKPPDRGGTAVEPCQSKQPAHELEGSGGTSADTTRSTKDGGKSGDGAAAKAGAKSALISTPLNVDAENCAVSTTPVSVTTSIAVTSAALTPVQRTRNVVVVVKSGSSTSPAIGGDAGKPTATTTTTPSAVVATCDVAQPAKKRSPRTVVLTPASVSMPCSAPGTSSDDAVPRYQLSVPMPCSTLVSATWKDNAGPYKLSDDNRSGMALRRQRSVDRRVMPHASVLRRMESSPCNLAAAAAPAAPAAGGPVVKATCQQVTVVMPHHYARHRIQPVATTSDVAWSVCMCLSFGRDR